MREFIVVAKQQRMSTIALSLTLASLAMLASGGACRAQDPAIPKPNVEQKNPGIAQNRTIDRHGMPHWLKARSVQTELEGPQPGDSRAEWYDCGCYDQPDKHFPYSVVVFKTPKGDLVARPERREGGLTFSALAVRHGDRYCALESDGESDSNCYGSFAHPCAFTDFRYGPYLAPFFPTCKSDEAEPALVPSDGTN